MNKKTTDIPFEYPFETSVKLKAVTSDIAKTIIIIFGTALLSETLYNSGLGNQIIIMVYILSVLIISVITSGYNYGILAAVLSTFGYDFLVTEPRMGFSFTIGFPITLFAMLFITLVASALTAQIKRQAKLALERENRATLLYEISQKLLIARDAAAIVKLTNEYLLGHIRRSVIFYAKDPILPDSCVFTQYEDDNEGAERLNSYTEREKAHKIYINPAFMDDCGKIAGGVHYEPIVSKGKSLGLIGVYYGETQIRQSGVLFIKMLAAQVALALELQYLSDEQNNILMESEQEKFRSTLLRAISHDIRTPLTNILGASSTVLEQNNPLESETNTKLILEIKENAQWLIRIVENLLSITKISDGAMRLNKTLEAAEEVVAQAVSIVRKRNPDCYIHIRSPQELLLVPMEATLISQVIINLLENSVKNSSSGSLILMDTKKSGDYAEFSVSDTGRGIPDMLLGNLFDTHSEAGHSADSVSGMGIGLSICKTIINAHGGTITGSNKEDGGAYFSFLLPLEEVKGVGETN